MKSIGAILRLLVDTVFPKDRRHSNATNNLKNLASLVRVRETKQDVTYLFDYQNPLVQDVIVTLKTSGDVVVAKEIGNILNEALLEDFVETKTFSSTPIIVTCIPISKNKRRERGFNQCEIVISEMGKQSGDKELIFNNKCLRVFRETEDQVGKSKSERIKNLNGAFVAEEQIVRDSNVFVIDDVTTTGATLLEAKRALIKAGAKKVFMVAIAH